MAPKNLYSIIYIEPFYVNTHLFMCKAVQSATFTLEKNKTIETGGRESQEIYSVFSDNVKNISMSL